MFKQIVRIMKEIYDNKKIRQFSVWTNFSEIIVCFVVIIFCVSLSVSVIVSTFIVRLPPLRLYGYGYVDYDELFAKRMLIWKKKIEIKIENFPEKRQKFNYIV